MPLPKTEEIQAKLRRLRELESQQQKQEKQQDSVWKKARMNLALFCEAVIRDEHTNDPIKLADIHRSWINHLLYCWANGLHSCILAPFGHGKCVVHGTRIQMADGSRMYVEDVKHRQVLAFDINTSTYKARDAVSAPNGNKPVVQVRMASGRRMTVTLNHPFLTDSGWVEAQHLEPDSRIMVSNAALTAPPIYMHEKKAMLLGAIAAVGRWQDGTVVIDTDDQETSQVLSALRKEAKMPASLITTTCGDAQAYRLAFAPGTEALADCGVTNRPSHLAGSLASVNTQVMQADIRATTAYLSGYFSLAGRCSHTWHDSIRVRGYTRDFLSDIQHLLWRLGIWSTIYRRPFINAGFPLGLSISDAGSLWVACTRLNLFGTGHRELDKLAAKVLKEDPKPRDASEVVYDKVVSVRQKGRQPTYSLEVDSTHTFVAEDLVQHNTAILGIALPLWLLGVDNSLRIKLYCASDSLAKERVALVRQYIEDSDEYHRVFPAVHPHPRMQWTSHRLYIDRPTKAKDASLHALGAMSSGIGGRGNINLFDDLNDAKNTLVEPRRRMQVAQNYRSVFMSRLDRVSGHAGMIATRWHEEDVPGMILADPEMRANYGFLVQRVSEDYKRIDCEYLLGKPKPRPIKTKLDELLLQYKKGPIT